MPIDARWAVGQSWLTSSANAWDRAVSLEPMQATPATIRVVPYNDYKLFAPVDDGNWRRIAATGISEFPNASRQ